MSSIKNLSLFIIVCFISLSILEIGSRMILLIPSAPEIISIDKKNPLNINFNNPDSKYLSKHYEYEAITTIDKFGNRVVPSSNENSNKNVVFLGDSFTFGLGVNDHETIPNLLCRDIDTKCVNLGIPGSGLIKQKNRLESFFRSNTGNGGIIFHLLFLSTEDMHAGNDLLDTLNEIENFSLKEKKVHDDSVVSGFIKFGRWLSRNSNFFRIVRVFFGNELRVLAWKNKNTSASNNEIKVFANFLNEIKDLATKNNFHYKPVLISSYAEKNLDKDEITFHKINKVSDINLLRLDYSGYIISDLFFPYDGHHNSMGAEMVKKNLVAYLEKINF